MKSHLYKVQKHKALKNDSYYKSRNRGYLQAKGEDSGAGFKMQVMFFLLLGCGLHRSLRYCCS